MKKLLVLLLAVSLLWLCACGKDAPAESPTPSTTPSPTPDYSDTDFTGLWHVAEIVDSNGTPVDNAKKQELGGDFTLELLEGGVYFVYDGSGKTLGQGAYSVTANQLALAAAGKRTVYEITDADTLTVTQPDGSTTVMRRAPEASEEE